MTMKVVAIMGIAMAIVVLLGVIFEIAMRRYDRKQKAPYQAADRFVAYHMGGLPGVRKKEKIQLLMNRDRLTIKPRRRPSVTMSTRDMRHVVSFRPEIVNVLRGMNREEPGPVPENMKFLSEVGRRREWTPFGRIKRYIVLIYEHNGLEHAVAFGFRYEEAELPEQETFNQCLDALEWCMENSWKRNPENAVGTVDLRKKSKRKNGRVVWRPDPASGDMRSEWEEPS